MVVPPVILTDMDDNPHRAPEADENPARRPPPRVDRWQSIQLGGLWFTVFGALGFVLAGVLRGAGFQAVPAPLFTRILAGLCPLVSVLSGC